MLRIWFGLFCRASCETARQDSHAIHQSVLLIDPAPDLTPDPSPFFSDFEDAKNNFFLHIYSFNLPAGTLSSV